MPLPFQQTPAGAMVEGADHWDVEGDVPVGVQVRRYRALPWLHTAIVPRFGRGLSPAQVAAAAASLASMARRRPVLSLRVEVWSDTPEERQAAAGALQREGFVRARPPRSYSRTIWMDLEPPEDDLLMGFHATCRRHIRAPGKRGYEVRPVTDTAHLGKIEEIFAETFARTGGDAPEVRWPELIREAGRPGAAVHMVGLYPPEEMGDEIVAFAVGLLHGDVGEYAHAGSVRDPRHKVPLLYAPTWDLIRWARGAGARWWDFGGVVSDDDTGSELRGIRGFKEYFSPDVIQVGEEWVLYPRPMAWRISRGLRALKRRARRDGAPDGA